ncbi:MAG TPA: efflux RND transporter permease subunit [Gemmata sp.]|nr:efflux RND transporter permease subunit [Gemmata sp.]
MISKFFIDRPIFATVLSVLITLAGSLALLALPIAQYPEISPPSVQVSITYPGASAQVVADTVAAPIEQQVNGVEGMLYMSSQSGNDGSYTLSVTFEIGTDLNTALVMVQNRIALAMPQLPSEVQLQGITIRKKTPDILQVISFFSDGRYDDLYLSNYATINIRDELLRVDGVSDINYFGERDYSIRIWLDPQKLAARNITAMDVNAAVKAQNLQVAPGQIGQSPTDQRRSFQFVTDTLGRLNQTGQFAEIVIKAGAASLNPALLPSTGSTGSGTTPTGTGPTNLAVSDLTGTATAGTSTSTPSTTSGSTSTPSTSAPSSSSGTAIYTFGTSSSSGAPGTTGGGTTGGPGTAGGAVSEATGSNVSGSTSMTSGMTGSSMTSSADGGGGGSTTVTTSGMVGPDSLAGGSLANGPWPVPGIVRLKDIAELELGAQSYTNSATFDDKPAVGLAIHLLPGANALDVADRVRAKMEELKAHFPDGMKYEIAYDTTPFIRESIDDVVMTLFEAIGLVALVVLVFLQNWRAAIIPLCAVPVAILGTFSVMLALGFTLNNISLFGLVLAIGIVVDDAIVVVENVERWLEKGLTPKEAAYKAMEEVTGPVIAIALVLCAVFVPCAFVGGITGQFFKQFAITITASTVFSAINSLTLSPALAAILMRPHSRRDIITKVLDLVLGWFFKLFNKGFEAGTSAYAWIIGRLLRVSLVVVIVYAGLLALTVWVFIKAPTGFVPDQDQGRLIISIQLPDSASLERSQEMIAQVERICLETPGIAHTTAAGGMSLLMSANSSNFGTVFVILKPFADRQKPELTSDAIMATLRNKFTKIGDADVKVFGAAPVPGLSVASGFKIMVEDRGGMGLAPLQEQTDALVASLQKQPSVAGVLTQFRSKTPQLFMDADRIKCQALGVALNDVNQTMQIDLGSSYVNSFNEFGRYWQVTAQAKGQFRFKSDQVGLLEVRNNNGDMVPLSTLVQLKEINGPVSVTRYNLYVAAAISGTVPPDVSSGDAIAAVDTTAEKTLPRAMATEWTELMFLQLRAGNTALYVFILAVVFVFLALAALYESWAMPLAVIMVVPMCMLCSVSGVQMSGKSVDIFVQIGLVVLVGLACKNAILIVEFASALRTEGKPRDEAAVEASRLRLRPILMTSFAFILGVLPLVFASGAGAEMRRSLGIAVFSGMLGVTLFGIFLTPVFFALIQRTVDSRFFSVSSARWGGSALLGGGVGAGICFLLARVMQYEIFWPTIAGGLIGAASALLIPAFWPRLWSEVRPEVPRRTTP